MQSFNVRGIVQMGAEEQTVEETVEAASKNHAKHLFYAKYGSEHGVPRARITITDVEGA